jgi:uncharacterized membrane-anchored protein
MNPSSQSKISHNLLIKVPEATVLFWIVKILTTGMGETTSDFLARSMDPVLAVVLGGVGLALALVWQFSTRRYIPWVYWLTVVMVSIFGTMAADVLHVGLGVPYVDSTIFYAVVLALILLVWFHVEKTLSIHSIHTRRREMFYWLTVLTTFALGTAVGDLTATTYSLGYFYSGVLFAVLIAIPAIAWWKLRLNSIVAFWSAYILTRPLGASFADWIGVPVERSGLGLGTGTISLILGVAILVLVGYIVFVQKDIEPRNTT